MRSGVVPMKALGVVAIAGALCIGASACGSSDSSDGGGGGTTGGSGATATVTGTGNVDGGGKEIVFFTNSKENPFVASQVTGAQEEAESLGYKLKPIYLPDQDQTTLDGLVRQFVASGEKPAAFIFWPANPKAAVNSTRQLSQIAPVIQTEERPSDQAQPFVKAYAGVDHFAMGENSGKQFLALRDKLRKEGAKFHSPEGNLLYLSVPPGFEMGDLRFEGLQKATASEPFNILKNDRGAYYSTQLGYQSSSKILPQYKDEVDFIYIDMTAAATGLVKALKENGLTPGKDVWIVTGNCIGGYQTLENGEIAGTQIQSPFAEGRIAVATAAKYLATGKVEPGAQTYPAEAAPPEVTATPPAELNFQPLITVDSAQALNDAKLWGVQGPETCK